MKTLLLSPRYTDDSRRVSNAARASGWSVVRPERWSSPPPIQASAYYGESLYGRFLQQQGIVRLLDPPHSWLPSLPSSMLGREVFLCRFRDVAAIWGSRGPCFAKPVDDKTFPAGVFETIGALPEYADPDEWVLLATPVRWEVEFRVFLCEGVPLACSRYAVEGDRDVGEDDRCDAASEVAARAWHAGESLPSGIVIDVGWIVGAGWAVVEANPAWGAGIYGCDPKSALKAIEASCVANPQT